MNKTVFLARLIGLYCLLAALVMLAQRDTWIAAVSALVHDPALMLLLGVVVVAAGLALVLAHNVWSGGALPIIVTLFGWASLIKGALLLLLSPEMESRIFITGLGYEQHPDSYALFLFLFGVYLTYAGFSASEARR